MDTAAENKRKAKLETQTLKQWTFHLRGLRLGQGRLSNHFCYPDQCETVAPDR
jgi:hypothetical protein